MKKDEKCEENIRIRTKLTARENTKLPTQQWKRLMKRKHEKKNSNYLLVVAF
jgi:hypothetical protein